MSRSLTLFLLLPILLIGLIGLTAVPAPTEAQDSSAPIVVRLDPNASTVTFTLGATLHTVEGSFDVTRGEIRFDPESGEASGKIVVDVTSGDTGKEGRDEDMHAKVLESNRYPKAVLTPTRIEGDLPSSGSAKLTLYGTLKLHGSTHKVSIPSEVTVDGDRLEATGSFRIPYVDWGMTDPSKFLLSVDPHVDVTLEAVGTLAS